MVNMADLIAEAMASEELNPSDTFNTPPEEFNFEGLEQKSNAMRKQLLIELVGEQSMAELRQAYYSYCETVASESGIRLPTDFELDDDDLEDLVFASISDELVESSSEDEINALIETGDTEEGIGEEENIEAEGDIEGEEEEEEE